MGVKLCTFWGFRPFPIMQKFLHLDYGAAWQNGIRIHKCSIRTQTFSKIDTAACLCEPVSPPPIVHERTYLYLQSGEGPLHVGMHLSSYIVDSFSAFLRVIIQWFFQRKIIHIWYSHFVTQCLLEQVSQARSQDFAKEGASEHFQPVFNIFHARFFMQRQRPRRNVNPPPPGGGVGSDPPPSVFLE